MKLYRGIFLISEDGVILWGHQGNGKNLWPGGTWDAWMENYLKGGWGTTANGKWGFYYPVEVEMEE